LLEWQSLEPHPDPVIQKFQRRGASSPSGDTDADSRLRLRSGKRERVPGIRIQGFITIGGGLAAAGKTG